MSYLSTPPRSTDSSQYDDMEHFMLEPETRDVENTVFGLSTTATGAQSRSEDVGGEKTKVADADVDQPGHGDGDRIDVMKSEKLTRTRSQTSKTADRREALVKRVQVGDDGEPLGRDEKQPAVDRGRDNQRLQELVETSRFAFVKSS